MQGMLSSKFARGGAEGGGVGGGEKGGQFKPFALDPDKQSRYEKFLEDRSSTLHPHLHTLQGYLAHKKQHPLIGPP